MSWFWWFEMEDARMIIDTAAGVFIGILAYQVWSAGCRVVRRIFKR